MDDPIAIQVLERWLSGLEQGDDPVPMLRTALLDLLKRCNALYTALHARAASD